jgi:hypothetical protein
MPMGSKREDPLIKLFLTAYEKGSWADAATEPPDAIDRTNPAVDLIATRKSDGKTLAIEHTIVEPFVQEKEDLAFFSKAGFPSIEKDTSLLIPGRGIEVFVPVGTLRNQPQVARDSIVQSVHAWIKSNRLALPEGTSQYLCSITGVPGRPPFDMELNIRVLSLPCGPGILYVRRQQVDNNLGQVIQKALDKKLPKLVNTWTDKRILLLERQHMNLSPQSILDQIEKRRGSFPQLADVNEIWIVETIFYGTAFEGTYLRFELYENGNVVRSFDFNDRRLLTRSEDGVAEVVHQ